MPAKTAVTAAAAALPRCERSIDEATQDFACPPVPTTIPPETAPGIHDHAAW